jgi:hypothetical protein
MTAPLILESFWKGKKGKNETGKLLRKIASSPSPNFESPIF